MGKLNWAVDGDSNSVVEVDTKQDPYGSDGNPHGNSWYVEETLLKSEHQAARNKNDATLRFWKFINPNRLNAMGSPTGYKLDPTWSIRNMTVPESPNGQRQSTYYRDL